MPKNLCFSLVNSFLLWEISNIYLSREILEGAPKPYLLKEKNKTLRNAKRQLVSGDKLQDTQLKT